MSGTNSLFRHAPWDDEAGHFRLKMEPRTSRWGCGIYEVGENGLRCFVTDSGRVMPVQGRMVTPEDLMEAYVWGRLDAEIAAGLRKPDGEEEDDIDVTGEDEFGV